MNNEVAVAVAHYPKLTYARFKKLWDYFTKFEMVWNAEIFEFTQAGWEEHVAAEFIAWREHTSVEKIMARLEAEHIETVILGQEQYPTLLSEITDPPFVLFVRGTLPINERPSIAVVGTRKCTTYGRQVTEELSRTLAAQGVVVVSGLALGIDGVAHEAALAAGGVTVAVLGSGVDAKTIYPLSHQKLAERIITQGGAIVSEYPPGFEPTQFSFPARNRIIAGLTLGTLVTEAPTESGALITFKYAIGYNREVFAVPHPITSTMGMGGNGLIKLGAKLVMTAQDILDDLQISNIEQIITNNEILPANPTEAKIMSLLSKEPVHVDALIKASKLESAAVNGALVMMEMKGKVKNVGGMHFILR